MLLVATGPSVSGPSVSFSPSQRSPPHHVNVIVFAKRDLKDDTFAPLPKVHVHAFILYTVPRSVLYCPGPALVLPSCLIAILGDSLCVSSTIFTRPLYTSCCSNLYWLWLDVHPSSILYVSPPAWSCLLSLPCPGAAVLSHCDTWS